MNEAKNPPCPRCQGSGLCCDCQGTGHAPCPACKGQGHGIVNGKEYPCRTCHGSGQVNCPTKCPSCNGQGTIVHTVPTPPDKPRQYAQRLVLINPHQPIVTKALIVICVSLYILAPPDLTPLLPQPYPTLIWHNLMATHNMLSNGEWWRLLTTALLHGNLLHIACNMYCLWSVGVLAERIMGWKRYLGLVLAGAVGGSLLSWFFNPTPGVGISTVFFAVAVALVYMSKRWKILPPQYGSTLQSALVIILVIGFAFNLLGQAMGFSFDNWGHIGGGLAGLLYIGLLPKPHR